MVKNSPTSKSGKSAGVGKPPTGRSGTAERLTTPAKVGKSGVNPRSSDGELSDRDAGETKEDDEWEMKPEPVEVKTASELQEQVQDLQAFLRNSGAPRPIVRNLNDDLAEASDDDDDQPVETKLFERESLPRVPVDTPTANLLLGRLANRMRAESEWMMMFSPVPLAQARWINVWPVAKAPVDSSSLPAVVCETQSFLKSIGFRCNASPSVFALESWSPHAAGAELLKWKKRLCQAFDREQEARVKGESAGLTDQSMGLTDRPAARTAKAHGAPMAPCKLKPATPAQSERFRATVGSPYFEDSHMLSPPATEERKQGRWIDENAEGRDDDYGSDGFSDLSDYSPGGERGTHRPSSSYAKESRRTIEVRTHAPLRKIELFGGRREKTEASMQWLKRFIYEMKGTKTPKDKWCEPFALCLTDGAKSWYGQLSKRTQVRWNLLCEAFLETYCAQSDQDPNMIYYQASRKPSEHVCDFLYRLNGYARKAHIAYTARGRVGRNHVEQFLLNCGDDDLADLIFPLGLDDIAQVERRVLNQLKGKRRQKLRDRQASIGRSKSREDDRRSDSRRDDRRSKDRFRESRSSRQETSLQHITLADAPVEVLMEAIREREKTAPPKPWSSDSELGESASSDSDFSAVSERRVDSAIQAKVSRSGSGRLPPSRADEQPPSQADRDHRDYGERYSDRRQGRQGGGAARENRRSDRYDRGGPRDNGPQEHCVSCGGRNHSAHNCWKRCKFCGQVHPPAQCELFQRLEKMTAFIKTNVDKEALPSDLKAALGDHLN